MSDDQSGFLNELERVAEAAVHDLERDVTKMEDVAAAFPSIGEWARDLELKNGRYCGPGEDLSQPLSPLDPCCLAHDQAYTSLGYSHQSMWSIRALLDLRSADAALVACVEGASEDGMDDATKTYRIGLLDGFKGRIAIADWLKAQGYGS